MVSPRLSTICGMPGCPVPTKGNFCTRHRDMTPVQQADELAEMRHRSARFDELFDHDRQLRCSDEHHDEQELLDAEEAMEEARLHLAELFGEPVEEGDES